MSSKRYCVLLRAYDTNEIILTSRVPDEKIRELVGSGVWFSSLEELTRGSTESYLSKYTTNSERLEWCSNEIIYGGTANVYVLYGHYKTSDKTYVRAVAAPNTLELYAYYHNTKHIDINDFKVYEIDELRIWMK